MAILNNSNAISAGGYDINNSLRFRASASAYLNRTPSVAGNQQKFTWSGWVKIGYFTTGYLQAADGNSGNRMTSWYMRGLGSTGVFEFEHFDGTTTYNLTTNAVFRDPSAWYHITVAVDTTQSTSADRTKIYVNGNQQTVTGTYVPQNTSLYVNGTTIQAIGSRKNVTGGYGAYFDGYMAEINFIDGQALTPSSFGSTNATTGVWQPAKYTGTYGTNGFYLKFSDIATTSGSNAGLGKDFSGNSNYWTTNNISVTSGTTYDAMTDSPTNTSATVANYATLNPLRYQAASALTYSEANLRAAHGSGTTSAGGICAVASTMSMTSGKWYFEFILNSFYSNGGATPDITFGVDTSQTATSGPGLTTGWGIYGNGSKYNAGSTASYGNSFTTNDIIGVAVDMDNGKIWFSKNGTWQASGDPAAGTNAAYTNVSGEVWAAFGNSTSSTAYNYNATANFGQRPFTYTPPTGYVALNTYNLPTPTILKGNKYMDATLYTGTGSGSPSINNAYGFKPDLVWAKCRNTAAQNNILVDSVRGANITLESNLTDAEAALSTIASFTSTGFTTSGTVANGYAQNVSGYTYVGWQWQAGQGSTSSNTSGSITSTVSVNTTAGFSIVTYTGTGSNATVGHGLGVAPRMIIVKQRSGAGQNWAVYHASLANTGGLALNLTNATITASGWWNNTSPTSSVFSLGGSTGSDWFTTNQSGSTYVAYCWAEIAGFSKFGSYTGNGSADGPFVATNFAPKFVMTKKTDTISNWSIHDSSRATYNLTINELYPDTSDAEYTGTNDSFDFLSNGFKARAAGTPTNASGGTYIFMAFAENPFKNSLAR